MKVDKKGNFLIRRIPLYLLGVLLLSACGTATVSINSSPPDAVVKVNGILHGTTPAQVRLEGRQVSHTITLEREGYAPDRFSVTREDRGREINRDLDPIVAERRIVIRSAPSGATVRVRGEVVGTTPLTRTFHFERTTGQEPWPVIPITLELEDYETERFGLRLEEAGDMTVGLARIRELRTYTVSAHTSSGDPLEATVRLDGMRVAGETPMSLEVEYRRASRGESWPTFTLEVEVPAKFHMESTTLRYDSSRDQAFVLEPLTEVMVDRFIPRVVMTPTSANLRVVRESQRGMLDVAETSERVRNLQQVTPYTRPDQRADARVESVNSFTLTPDGANLIFALTQEDGAGNYYSNLFIKNAADSSGGITRLTQGSRFLDTWPVTALDGSNTLIFQSNRSDRSKPDLFRARLDLAESRFAGGITRITSDNRFNYHPTFYDSNREVMYLSIERDFPLAVPQISSIRLDGSATTLLQESGVEIDYSHHARLYVVQKDDYSNNKQIYAITPDGKLKTFLINQEDFLASNCHQPRVNPDGSQVLFVSDRGADERGRRSNNIYVMNADGSNIRQLTQNASDDILPQWSPTEEGVVFFISNRGGAYNVWRMEIQ